MPKPSCHRVCVHLSDRAVVRESGGWQVVGEKGDSGSELLRSDED